METIVAIDIGTTGAKATLISRQGKILASAYVGYPTDSRENRVEQSPDDWWEAACASLHSLREQHPHLKPVGIALSGQMQDVILVDTEKSLAPAILYADTRAQQEARQVLERLGEERLQQVTGNLQDASGLLAKLLWLKEHRPALYQSAHTLLVGAHDYLAWKLGGARVADYTTAATTGLLDLKANAWADGLFKTLGLRLDWLPELVPAEARVGQIDEAAAKETGLPAGLPIFHGAGDAATTTLGAGAGEPGRYYVYLGTSGWLAATQTGEPADPRTGIFNLRHPDPAQLIMIGPMLTAAGNFEWLRQQFGPLELAAWPAQEANPYDILNAQAAQAPAGSHGVIYLPYLAGERSPFRDAHARGVFFGLTVNTTRQDLYRAVLEGVAFSMRAIRQAMSLANQMAASELSLVGGGARSALWAQIFADVFACRVKVLADPGDVGARGAALIAGKALGWYDSFWPNAAYFPVQGVYEPASPAVQQYDRLFTVFGGLYPALQASFTALGQVMKPAR
ncbi:MAG: FGGY-family carbohydrate kinase [Chloroflexota bacterium]